MATEVVSLTAAERADRAQSLALKQKELKRLDAEKKAKAKDYKLRMDLLAREIEELSETVITGEEVQTRTFFDSHISDDDDYS